MREKREADIHDTGHSDQLGFTQMRAEFSRLFPGNPRIFRAPGRVNLIGEHTDYNDGYVMPAAIDRATWLAAGLRTDRRIFVHSHNFGASVEIDLDHIPAGQTGQWSDYVRGVAAVLKNNGAMVQGANLFVHSDVPIGAGLSSSAAIEVATACALLTISGLQMTNRDLAVATQQAEHEYAGTQCGIMDQFVIAHAQAGQVLLLDTRTLEYALLALPAGVSLVICNTKVKHSLASGEYNLRRQECLAGVEQLRKRLPHINALRDVSLDDLHTYGSELPEVIFRRCRHVVSENQRVLEAARALRSDDLEVFGDLMYASHSSLRDDFEVSCFELDLMVDLASHLPGVRGARMTGGGFGGCTVNLVNADEARNFGRDIASQYEEQTGVHPEIYITVPSVGVEEIIARDENLPAKSA
jgi:galactokinase